MENNNSFASNLVSGAMMLVLDKVVDKMIDGALDLEKLEIREPYRRFGHSIYNSVHDNPVTRLFRSKAVDLPGNK